jgi:hypothetical protein
VEVTESVFERAAVEAPDGAIERGARRASARQLFDRQLHRGPAVRLVEEREPGGVARRDAEVVALEALRKPRQALREDESSAIVRASLEGARGPRREGLGPGRVEAEPRRDRVRRLMFCDAPDRRGGAPRGVDPDRHAAVARGECDAFHSGSQAREHEVDPRRRGQLESARQRALGTRDPGERRVDRVGAPVRVLVGHVDAVGRAPVRRVPDDDVALHDALLAGQRRLDVELRQRTADRRRSDRLRPAGRERPRREADDRGTRGAGESGGGLDADPGA